MLPLRFHSLFISFFFKIMQLSKSNNNVWLINALLTTLFVVIVGIIIWGMNKGFDLSDEGLHMHLLTYPTEGGKRGGYQWFFSWMHLSILGAKTLRLLLMLLSAGVFSWGMWCWMSANDYFKDKTNVYNLLTLFAFIGIGTFVNFAQQPRTLSYNTLTLVCMQLIAGLFLYANALYKQRRALWQLAVVALSILPILYVLYEAKFTSAISMVLLLVFVQVLWLFSERPSFKGLLVWLIAGFASLVFVVMLYCFLKKTSPFELYNNLYYELWQHYNDYAQGKSPAKARHNIIYVLISYYNSSYKAIKATIFDNAVIVVLFAMVFGLHRFLKNTLAFPKNNYVYYITPLFLLAILGLYSSEIVSEKWHINGDKFNRSAFNLYLFTLGCLLASCLALVNAQAIRQFFSSHSRREIILVCFMLFMIPIGGAAGTNNPLPLQCTQQIYAWFAIFFLLTYYLTKQTEFVLPQRIWVIVISLFAFSQIYYGYVYNTFRINGSLFDQKYEIKNLPRAEGMLFDTRTKTMVQKINNLLHERTNFTEGDPIVALTYSPGLVYLLGGISPYSPYYKNESSYADRNCNNIVRASLPNIENTIVMDFNDRRIKPDLINCFLMQGIDLASDYVQIGSVPFYNGKKGRKLAIYAPKHLLKNAHQNEEEQNDKANADTNVQIDSLDVDKPEPSSEEDEIH